MKGITVRVLTAIVMVAMILSLTAAKMPASAAAFTCKTVTGIPVTECDALVAFYNAAGGPTWTNNSGWLSTTFPWFGVTVANGHVTQINLPANNLTGYITPKLGSGVVGTLPQLGLPQLEKLDLSGNALTNKVPNELGFLRNLNSLNLSGNQLSGSIPGQLAGLPDTLPPEPGSLVNYLLKLKLLDLSHNQFSGEIPFELGYLINLTQLHLNDNLLCGEVPSALVTLVNIQPGGNLTLDHNQLTLFNPYPHEPPTALEAFLMANNPDWYKTQGIEETIDPAVGGEIAVSDGSIAIIFDPGDLGLEGGKFKLAVESNPTDQKYGAFNFAGKSFVLDALDATGNRIDGFKFAHPVTVKLTFKDADLGNPPANELKFNYYDTTAKKWVDAAKSCTPASTYTIDYAANPHTLKVDICHLSEFAMLSSNVMLVPQLARPANPAYR